MDEFNFYNSENDGYRGSFGDYTDPTPGSQSQYRYSQPVDPGQPPKKSGMAKKIIAVALACTILGGAAGVGGAAVYLHYNNTEESTTIYQEERPQVQTVVNSNNGQPMTAEELYAANLASCVGITVNTTVNIFGQTTTSAASGSCWPGVKTIARDLGLSRSTVRRALKELEHSGWVQRQARYRHNGSRSSNLYTILR